MILQFDCWQEELVKKGLAWIVHTRTKCFKAVHVDWQSVNGMQTGEVVPGVCPFDYCRLH